MNWESYQINNLDNYKAQELIASDKMSSQLLEWITNNLFFKTEIFEDNIVIANQTYYRFYIKGLTPEGINLSGFGRSKNRLTAASIASGELIERFVAKMVFKDHNIKSNLTISSDDGSISVETKNQKAELPIKELQSSNGWSVHFDIKKAIENSFLEALERHTLLYTYLKDGWNGFKKDQVVPFNHVHLTPHISKHSFGGYTAGLVTTKGTTHPGQTFGYLCDSIENIAGSKKWLSAFFESHDQWELLSKEKDKNKKTEAGILKSYQKYYLDMPPRNESDKKIDSFNADTINANLIVFDLQRALDLPCPFFAAFTYGQDLIPLFFKQKMSGENKNILDSILSRWSLPLELPEYHPIL